MVTERKYLIRTNVVVLLFALIALPACTGSEPVVEPDVPTPMNLAHAIIPAPASADLSQEENFSVTDDTDIVVDAGDEETTRIGRYLAALIGNTVETTPDVVAAGVEGAGPHVRLRLEESASQLGDEGYDLDISPDEVTLTAAGPAGLFYGVQTIRQLFPPYVEYGAAYELPLTMPVGRIIDAPRFEWRGAMLDVARHFLPPQHVKRYIDLMAMYKLNRLHVHLSDDQGWRIEIPGRPRLTTHGASTEVGGGPGGYYSTGEWAELVQYAQERYVTLVPEIDVPGHTNAALASYPELTCDGVTPELYTGTEVGFSYLCVEKEETYEFLEDVVREISEITPGPYFHLGGDEVHELSEEQYVQFMERAQDIVASHGKRVMGWDEIAEVDLDLLPGTVVQVWRPQTDETAAWVSEAVNDGASIVLSPADRIYLDMKYDTSTILGLSWAGYNSVRDAYDWAPEDLIPGISEGAIIGIEAPIWSETLTTIHDFEYMAFPRLAGVAEIAWSPASERSWDEYRHRLGAQGARWIALGVNFYRAPGIPWHEM